MVYTNERWNYQLHLPDGWRLQSEGGGQPEFSSDSASLKIAAGPVPMGRRPQDELFVLRSVAAKYGHRVTSDGLLRADGLDHATITCDAPGLGILKTYGLVFLDREFLITGAGDLKACDAAVMTFQLMDGPSNVIDPLVRRAKAGDPDAQFTLGLHYHDGQDHSKAFEWVLKAADGGHPIAQMNAGVCYANGEGTKVNLVEAMKWVLLSKKAGYRGAGQALASIRSQLRPDQIAEATSRADAWQSRSWSVDEGRQYLKRTGDFAGSGCAVQAVVLTLLVLAMSVLFIIIRRALSLHAGSVFD
jgi:hypothetical protein